MSKKRSNRVIRNNSNGYLGIGFLIIFGIMIIVLIVCAFAAHAGESPDRFQPNEPGVYIEPAVLEPASAQPAEPAAAQGDFPWVVEYSERDVKKVQTALANRGYLSGVDGIFGPNTGTAVKLFQIDIGLEPDGIVGPMTAAELGIELEDSYSVAYVANLPKIAAGVSADHLIYIACKSKTLTVFTREASGYWSRIGTYDCAIGMATAWENITPLGVHYIWSNTTQMFSEFGYNWYNPSWFEGEYGIHSVAQDPYTGEFDYTVLGSRITNGCVRVREDVAEWIQNYCPIGTPVIIDDRNYDPR